LHSYLKFNLRQSLYTPKCFYRGPPSKTGEISELKTVDFFDHLSSHLVSAENITSINPHILRLFKAFEPETTDEMLVTFIEGLQANGFSEERILDVLLYTQERQQNGEKIRNVMGYLKHGLKSGIMGLGLAKIKGNQEKTKADNARWDGLAKSPQFSEWLQTYII
jgi:hypothetical protein